MPFAANLKTLPRPSGAVVSYVAAMLLGVGVTLYMMPLGVVFVTHPFLHPINGDPAQNIIGQRYFIADSWRWPLLLAKNLVPPNGVNVAFMDSIPLAVIPMKLIRGLLPPGAYPLYFWLALCWVLQPVAAVFALRGTGERRTFPSLAIAVISISIPTLLNRVEHAALCSHFLILLALGLYFRIVRHPSAKLLVAAAVMMLCSLLVHPYIMLMVMAVLAAAPLTLLLRRQAGWMAVAGAIVGGIAATGIVAVLLGYGQAVPVPGFGHYSMNALSPIYPYRSAVFKGFPLMDATGGQYEGYQYLGVGVILLVLLCDFCLGPREKIRLLIRQGGILAACLALTLLALSNKIYVGDHLLLSVGPKEWLVQFRATGRLFWPVTYVLVVGSIVLVCRYLPKRVAYVVLIVAAALQFVDASQVRRSVRHYFRSPASWVVDAQQLRPLIATHSKLTILPKLVCVTNYDAPEFMQLGLLASETAIPINTMYVGREASETHCVEPKFPIQVANGELLALLPPRSPAMSISVKDWQDICRQVGILVVCSQQLRGRSDLAVPQPPVVSVGTTLETRAGKPGIAVLGFGYWSSAEDWGIWNDAPVAQIAFQPEAPAAEPLQFTACTRALAPRGKAFQRVVVSVNGEPAAIWNVAPGADREYSVEIPPRGSKNPTVYIELRPEQIVSPKEIGLIDDVRKLGFGLVDLKLQALPQTKGTIHRQIPQTVNPGPACSAP